MAPASDTTTPGSVRTASFTPLADRRSVLDRAHRGDIEGAFGRVASSDTGPRPSIRRRLITLLAIMGPGVVVMVADNDAGGLSIYAQAGQDHGLRLLGLVLLLAPVLFVNQEMVARLGAVSGAGHARLIFERFGRRWGTFALVDLLALNFLTLITEFIGVALGLGYFGVSRVVSVPIAAVLLIAVTTAGSFRRWERAMYALVVTSLLAVPLLVIASLHHHVAVVSAQSNTHPAYASSFVFFTLAVVGTTVAPWQLFFHQSSVVDKRITPRWLSYERVDTAIGAGLFSIGALAVLAACAVSLHHLDAGAFVDAGHTARQLSTAVGPWAGALFAIVLVDGSVLGGGAVTLSTSYAVGDVYGTKHSLHRRPRDAPAFHGSFAGLVVAAAAVVLLPGVSLGITTVGVQVLAGTLLPSATVFLLLLANDKDVLGPRVNSWWLNLIAVEVVGALMALSALLTLTTLFPHLETIATKSVLAAVVMLGCGYAVCAIATRPRHSNSDTAVWERVTWTTPPLDTLPSPRSTPARTVGLLVLRGYLLVAFAAAVVKIVELLAHG